MYILIILCFMVLAAIEVPPLAMRRRWGELIVSSLLLGIAFVYALNSVMGHLLPGIGDLFFIVFSPIFQLLNNLLS